MGTSSLAPQSLWGHDVICHNERAQSSRCRTAAWQAIHCSRAAIATVHVVLYRASGYPWYERCQQWMVDGPTGSAHPAHPNPPTAATSEGTRFSERGSEGRKKKWFAMVLATTRSSRRSLCLHEGAQPGFALQSRAIVRWPAGLPF